MEAELPLGEGTVLLVVTVTVLLVVTVEVLFEVEVLFTVPLVVTVLFERVTFVVLQGNMYTGIVKVILEYL